MNSNFNLKLNKMKKQLFMLIVTATFTITNQLNAQNIFPASGNVGIGTTVPNQKFEVIGGSILTDGTVHANGWFKSYGSSGWYNETFAGGICMTDNTWIRTYNNKAFYSSNTIRTDGEFQVGDSGNRFVVKGNGNVGLGIIDPFHKLEVNGSTMIKGTLFSNYISVLPQNNSGEGGEIFLQGSNASFRNYHIDNLANTFRIFTNTDIRFIITDNGNTGIGTFNPDEKFTVKGKIHAEEVRIDLQVPADYVFEKYYTGNSSLKSNYIMPTLSEVEKFTKENNHLPDVPSAKEIKEKGLQVGEMSNILLQKIEEMTLYIIEMKKEIQQLQKENQDLKSNQEQK